MALDLDLVTTYLAATGPVTGFVEATAASIGAGMLLGGFVAGSKVLVPSRHAHNRERLMVDGSSVGGLFMALALVAEAFVR